MGALSILVDGMLPSTSTRSPDGTAIHCCFVFVETGVGGGEGGEWHCGYRVSTLIGFFRLHLSKHKAALVHGLKSGFLAEFLSFFIILVG